MLKESKEGERKMRSENTVTNTINRYRSFRYALILEGVAVGAISGVVVVAFRYLLGYAEILLNSGFELWKDPHVVCAGVVCGACCGGHICGDASEMGFAYIGQRYSPGGRRDHGRDRRMLVAGPAG